MAPTDPLLVPGLALVRGAPAQVNVKTLHWVKPLHVIVKALPATPLDGVRPMNGAVAPIADDARHSQMPTPSETQVTVRRTMPITTSNDRRRSATGCSIPDQSRPPNRGFPMGRLIAAMVALATLLVFSAATPAAAGESDEPLRFAVTLNGQNIADATIPIEPSTPAELAITVSNGSDTDRKVRSVRLSGTVLALTFFAYDTTVPFDVPAHGRVSRTFRLDLADLDGQAIGLLPSTVELVDAQHVVLASAATVADVRGSVTSVYGVFGLAVLILTLLAWATALVALARHRLPANRWRRALRFLPAGFGTGLVAVITLSVLRMVPPAPAVELPVIAATTAVAMLLGYLTPHPLPQVVTPTDDPTTRLTEGLTG